MEQDDEKPIRERYAAVLDNIGGPTQYLSEVEAFDLEVKRVALSVEPYLRAHQDWLEAESLRRVLDRRHGSFIEGSLEQRTQVDDLVREVSGRVKALAVDKERLNEEHRAAVDRLTLLLKLRRLVNPKPPGT